jgi:ABC-type glycerol-3-phosphate transport system substrate-binding protein
MGDFSNVANPRELLASLFLQLGNPITKVNPTTQVLQTTLSIADPVNPIPALQFFSQFVDPTNVNYSWNRSMPDSKKAFLSGVSATYFGFASELASIRARNPNLNFDVGSLPQARSGGAKAAYAKMLGFSLVKSSPNTSAAYQVISNLTAPAEMKKLAGMLYAASPRRDVIAQGTADQYISIFNQSALIGRTWLDMDPLQSEQIFSDMVSSFTSGQKTAYQAIEDSKDRYDIILRTAF